MTIPIDTPAKVIARKLEQSLSAGFVGREEEARVAILALFSKSHAVLIGPPGTGKSALIIRLSQLISCRYFYYLLSKYTVPDELVGEFDIPTFRSGKLKRNFANKLPSVEIAFIDEIFKGSSETLNSILNIMNERKFVDADGTVHNCPLWSLYGASNETPIESELMAFYDRFLIKHFVKNIPIELGEQAVILNSTLTPPSPIITLQHVKKIYDEITSFMKQKINGIAKVIAALTAALRQEGIPVSDRTMYSVDYFPRLLATYAFIYDADIRNSAIKMAKYIVHNEEGLQAYLNAIKNMFPPEITTAREHIENARRSIEQGDLRKAREHAMLAIQSAKEILGKGEKAEAVKEELTDILTQAEKIVNTIDSLKKQLEEVKQ